MKSDAPAGSSNGSDAAISGWSTRTHEGADALLVLQREWDGLHARCATATPFQSAAWNISWWAAYGTGGQLRLVVVRRAGRLVAGAALVARRRRTATVLTPVGAGQSDYEDVLVDDGCAAEATRWLAAALLADRRWDHLEFTECRPGSAARRLHDCWPGPRWRGAGSVCLELPVAPLTQTLAGLPRDTAKSLRRNLRQIDAAGFVVSRAPAEQGAEAIRDLLHLHRLQWRGRPDVNPEHLTPRFERHLAAAAGELIGSGQAVVLRYRRHDRLVASALLLVGRDTVGGYLFGFDPALRELISVIVMLDSRSLVVAGELGRPVLSMLRGVEPYKLRWRPRPVPNERLVMARPGRPAGTAYALYLRGRAAAVGYAGRRFPRLLATARSLAGVPVTGR